MGSIANYFSNLTVTLIKIPNAINFCIHLQFPLKYNAFAFNSRIFSSRLIKLFTDVNTDILILFSYICVLVVCFCVCFSKKLHWESLFKIYSRHSTDITVGSLAVSPLICRPFRQWARCTYLCKVSPLRGERAQSAFLFPTKVPNVCSSC